MNSKQMLTFAWFASLRDMICKDFEDIEFEFCEKNGVADPGKFSYKKWDRPQGGGGEMGLMKGRVFEKVGVNVSKVFGEFSEEFRKEVPGTEESGKFFACGISLVAHMASPLVPALHMNTRYIETGKSWFGGGIDMTPAITNDEDKLFFHKNLKDVCDSHDPRYYQDFSKRCDEYFFIKHRNETRGVGGIFFDYLNTQNFNKDFAFVKDVGKFLLGSYHDIVVRHMNESWTEEQKEAQLIKRGRYVEFNLMYDRGTRFGFMTGGNPEAILMSMPPVVKWV